MTDSSEARATMLKGCQRKSRTLTKCRHGSRWAGRQWQRILNRAIISSRINCSGYVGHATIFSWMLTTAWCLVVGLGSGLGLGLGLDLVSGWLVVMHTYYFPLSLPLSRRDAVQHYTTTEIKGVRKWTLSEKNLNVVTHWPCKVKAAKTPNLPSARP